MEDYAALLRAHDLENTRIQFQVDGDVNIPAPPMLLATLFENAVKHGRASTGELWIEVSVTVGDDHLTFQMENSHPHNQPSQPGLGLGLDNVRRRLELLFPGRHRLTWNALEDRFQTLLEIHL